MARKSILYTTITKFIFTIVALFSVCVLHAQVPTDSTTAKDSIPSATLQNVKNKKSSTQVLKNRFAKYDLSKRAIDHFMFQFGYTGWSNSTGEYNLHGFSRQFNAAFMFDKAFKSNPHFSFGYGIGYSSDNFFLNGKYADIRGSGTSQLLTISDAAGGTDFKKFKLVFNYVEIPLELRISKNIENPTKGFRFAIGLKGGLLLSAHSKGKNLINTANQSLYGSGYVEKQYSKRFFNSTKVDATMRASMGIFTVYGTYQITSLLKSTAGPTINPYSIGIGLSIM